MIITKTPFRVSFCGGGSDMANFYEKYGGCVLSTSINKYCYISIHPYFNENQTVLKYSENELVDSPDQIKHRIFRQVLTDMGIHGVEISSTADIPGGTGLGSSSTFTVGLLNSLNCYKGKFVSKDKLAKLACEVEIEKLGNPIGKQDQYGAALGGLNFIKFNQDGSVSHEPILMEGKTYKELQKNLLMFYTGTTRSANTILAEQTKNITSEDKARNLLKMCGLAKDMKVALENNDISSFGKILDEGWQLKKELASGIANPAIDEAYEIAMKNGALGGKLLGAGGGGFLLFYCEEEKQEQLKKAIGLRELDFSFERDGTSIVYIGDKYWD
ncbi:GHMP kinase [Lachnoanaerobaculum saburreum]|uniref:GHMP kinase protein n=1 Tax=Lachnoanaerobaculum saburreum TaxID=467210 RepID=A0A134A069_9FIRM|nr:GHMP kinase [Lachnoanaerobaculum saburreum]KXB61063.1 GHMP kinase protein [Lachnoanaerobaculum saburreum]